MPLFLENKVSFDPIDRDCQKFFLKLGVQGIIRSQYCHQQRASTDTASLSKLQALRTCPARCFSCWHRARLPSPLSEPKQPEFIPLHPRNPRGRKSRPYGTKFCPLGTNENDGFWRLSLVSRPESRETKERPVLRSYYGLAATRGKTAQNSGKSLGSIMSPLL